LRLQGGDADADDDGIVELGLDGASASSSDALRLSSQRTSDSAVAADGVADADADDEADGLVHAHVGIELVPTSPGGDADL
jgi:hypothetical protein